MLDYRILGRLELVDDGRPVQIGARKQRALLLCLLLRPNEAVSADRLVDALWGERPPDSAPKLVQVYVSQLRRALGDGVLETRGSSYVILAAPEQVDAARFERLLAEGREASAAGNAGLAASLLRRGLGLWRGRALEDVADERFASLEAGRLEDLRLVALEERIAADLAGGGHDEVLAELTGQVTAHPLRERMRILLMLALYRNGRQADALDVYRDASRRLQDELGLDPGPELRELEGAILRQDASLAPPQRDDLRGARVPVPATPLVGREGELDRLRTLVGRPDVRLVTLSGAGGSGKTRLALALAAASSSEFANGAAFVPLAALHDPQFALPAVIEALGIAEQPGVDVEETLVAWLSERELLLVLDNLEHLTGVEALVARLVAAAPRLKVIATSRRVLHVSGEHVFPVQPLAQDDAVTLFVERARALDASFALTGGDEQAVREVCRRLDGLPLAIELAAARTNLLTPEALLTRLSARLTLLTRGAHDLPARQQTLRDTLAWSADLLAPEERRDLARLAVFARSWRIDVAEAVCGADLERLATLVDHSLVRREAGAGPERFMLLETVREYALELLDTEDDGDEQRRRHAAFFLDLAEQGEVELAGADQAAWLERLEAEHDEFRIALAHLAETGALELELRLAAALGRFRYVRGHLVEARATLEGALARSADAAPALRAKALRVASAICILQDDYPRALVLAEAARELYRVAGDRAGEARVLNNLGAILSALLDDEAAARALDEAIAVGRELGEQRLLALALNNRGDMALIACDWGQAHALFEESLGLLCALGDEVNVARSLFNLGATALEQGQDAEARELLLDSLGRCLSLDDKEDIAWCFVALAALRERAGEPERGAALLGAAESQLAGMGANLKPYERRMYEQTAAALRARVGEDGLAAGAARGREMTLDQLLETSG